MADVNKTVEIVFGGVDRVSSVTRNIDREVSQMAGAVGNVSAPLANMANAVWAVDAALLAVGGTMVGFSISEAGKFKSSTNEINTLLDVTDEQFEGLRDGIRDYARESTAGIEDINAAVYSAISAGVDYEQSLGALSTAERLAVGGKAGLEASLVGLVSTMNAYGASTEEATDFSDVFFTTVRQGQTTIPELNASLSNVTGTAAALDIPFSTLGASIATLTAAGAPTSQAITRINSALSSILKPSSEASKTAKALGLEFDATALKTKGLQGFLIDVKKAVGDDDAAMAKLFGSTEALGAVNVLVGKGAQKFALDLKAMEDRAGSTQTAFDKMADNIELATQNMVTNIRLTAEQFGEPFLDEYIASVDGLGDVFKGLGVSINEGAFGPLTDALEAFGESVAKTLKQIGGALPAALAGVDFDPILRGADSVVEALRELFDNPDLTDIDELERAIQFVVDGLGGLGEVTAGQIEGLELLWDSLVTAAEGFVALGADAQKSAGLVLGIAQSVDTLLPAVTGLVGGLNNLTTALTLFVGVKAVGSMTALAGASAGLASGLGKAGLAGAIGLASYELGRWINLNDILVPGVDTLGTRLYALFNDPYDPNAGGGTTRGLEDIKARAEAAVKPVGDLDTSLQTVVDSLNGFADNPVDLAPFVTASELPDLGSYLDVLGGKVSGVESAVNDLGGALEDVGDTKLGQGIDVTGFKAELAAAKSASGQFVKTWQDGIPTFTAVGNAAASAMVKTARGVDDALEKTQDFELALLQLQSKERLGIIKVAAEVDIASIEAEAKKVVAAFGSINTSISESAKLTGKALDSLRDEHGLYNYDAVEQLRLSREESARASNRQGRLIDKQIEAMDAQIEASNRGDAMITVNGDGLAPHLEAMMFYVLEAIQVRGSVTPGTLLVGCPG